jgi:hypothetical protein
MMPGCERHHNSSFEAGLASAEEVDMPRNNDESLPESGMGGASDAGAHGLHPASATRVEGSPLPDDAPGDATIERRRHRDSNYGGPERRIGGTKHGD